MPVAQRTLEIAPGSEVGEYTLTNSRGLSVSLLDFGGVLTAVRVPDRDGRAANVVLAFDGAEAYRTNAPYFGVICGRFANRIAGGRFTLDGDEFRLATNNPPNHLHGGERGLSHYRWAARVIAADKDPAVELQITSPHGDEGFPGTLTVRVRYTLTEQDALQLDYWASSDRATPVNLTNHAYWNLSGARPGNSVLSHHLKLHCSRYLPVDACQIPTGELRDVAGTVMDFREPHAIGERFGDVQGGYDHCYVVDREQQAEAAEPVAAARVVDPASGRVMEVWTTEPGIQLYTGNFLDGSPACGGFAAQEGLCLECQHFPDSPNRAEFPSTILRPGQTYRQTTVHRFSVAGAGADGT